MTARLETIARATDSTHLELETPLVDVKQGQRMKVLITLETAPSGTSALPDFRSAIGSYYRDFPDAQPMTTVSYLQTLRDGDAD